MDSDSKYKPKKLANGKWAVLLYYSHLAKPELHSVHDTEDEAEDTIIDLNSKPTQADSLRRISELNRSMSHQ